MNDVVRHTLRLLTEAGNLQHRGHQWRKQCNDNTVLNTFDRQAEIYQHENDLKTYYQYTSIAQDDGLFMQIKVGTGRKRDV